MNKPSTSSGLELIARFADSFALPIEAHEREKLSPEDEVALRKLAAGELGPGQRASLVPILARNESAMEFLASIAKGNG